MRIRFFEKQEKIKFPLFFSGLLFLFLTNHSVWWRKVNNFSLPFYILGLILFCLVFIDPREGLKALKRKIRKIKSREVLFFSLILLFGIGLRLDGLTNPLVGHQDEFITAYTSWELKSHETIDWFATYPQKEIWVCRFPIIFHAFQKPFFDYLGPKTWVVRFSVWPYFFLIFLGVYLIGKELFSVRVGLLSAFVLAVLAVDRFFSSLGLHFISSTCFLTLAFLAFLKAWRNHSNFWFIAWGLMTALCYLTYSSSYLALPFFILLTFLKWCQKKVSFKLFKQSLLGLAVFFLVISPFLIYAFKVDNFFLQRMAQVNFFSGSWSEFPQKVAQGDNPFLLFLKQVENSFLFLFKKGIGGAGGYWFGHLALFDALTAFFFILGIIIFLYFTLVKRKFAYYSIFCLVIAGIIFGLVLMAPPPAPHRLTLIYPFLAVILGVSLDRWLFLKNSRWRLKKNYLSWFWVSFWLVVFFLANHQHYQKAANLDYFMKKNPDVIVSEFVKESLSPQDNIYIAAFPGFHLKRELFFRSNGLFEPEVGFLNEVLREIKPGEEAIIIMHRPDSKRINQLRNFSSKIQMIWMGEDYKIYDLTRKSRVTSLKSREN